MLLPANAVFSLAPAVHPNEKGRPEAAFNAEAVQAAQNLCQTPTSNWAFFWREVKPSPLCFATSV